MDTTIRVAYHLGFQIELLMAGISTLDSDLLTATQIKQHHAHIWEHRFAEFVTADAELDGQHQK